MNPFVEPLHTSNNELQLIGGKGRSLAILAKSGFKVPVGFHLTTKAYKAFIDSNSLQSQILSLAVPSLQNGNVSFEAASNSIRTLILNATIPSEIVEAIHSRYKELEPTNRSVAVRSSANAEDLPGLSFAGQHETFLNVRGEFEVSQKVKQCWASLWTPQAMGYRHQNGIDSSSVAMAVVVQSLVPADTAGILFTANPASGERSEMVINASYGLGEAVVSGQITPDTYILDATNGRLKDSTIGSKEHQIQSSSNQGVLSAEVGEAEREQAVLTHQQVKTLWEAATQILSVFDEVPQDIEFAFSEGQLFLLQSRPITNLPVQPIDLKWEVPKPAKFVARRQIVENMPDPICPLFESLYLTQGLEWPRRDKSLMVGGGPIFITVNGYAYQRFDFPMVHQQAKEKGLLNIEESEIDIAEYESHRKTVSKLQKVGDKTPKAQEKSESIANALKEQLLKSRQIHERDVELFAESLSVEDRKQFKSWFVSLDVEEPALTLARPKSDNPTYTAFNNTQVNDHQLAGWFQTCKPRLEAIGDKWRQVDPNTADSEVLYEGICELGIEEGNYWSSNASHTFGVAKSTDDQLQCFLRETLPEHHFISGQFLSGIESKTMQANVDLFKIAQEIRKDEHLKFLTLVTPPRFLLNAMREQKDASGVLTLIDDYLARFGHQGYSMDFVEPTQIEDPTVMMTALRAMVADDQYDPKLQELRATRTREEKTTEITKLLSGLEYWQFRFRLWLARKYHYIREEVAYMFGFTWVELRAFAHELGRRLKDSGILGEESDVYFLTPEELKEAVQQEKQKLSNPEFGTIASERRELREARKRHHPPGTLPEEASQIGGIAFKETQIKNQESESVMRGFPVSSGSVTAPASVITSQTEFENMKPGSILVSPLTTPAWTQLFAQAVGLVTDVGSILAHGSIVAREYGIPAVLGVGNGTQRIKNGQIISIDGDQGIVELDPES